ncbi:hypothetical protein LOK49_Contig250G00004 [Camellia lanceoleosa]|nr:hypothetical protein LOK49_Contig250G00004 [Camellia lanceoleosa]
MVRERLDRGVANAAWLALFPMARVFHLTCTTSDHIPTMVDLLGQHKSLLGNRRRPHIYRFEAMWLRDERCEEVVKANWGTIQEPTMDSVRGNMEKVSMGLSQWDKTTFGHV